jgi:diguanylate cyclase (GGDEF)-like protein
LKKHFTLLIFLFSGVGMAASLALAWVVWNSETHDIQERFTRDVDERVALLDRQISVNFETLYSLRALYDASELVTRSEFRTAASTILRRHPDIQALEWAPKVTHAKRRDYELAARNEGLRDFQIRQRTVEGEMVPADERPLHFPVFFVEPLEGNQPAVGFDLASSSKRLETLSASQESGELLATASMELVQETANDIGFLAFLPVYHGAPKNPAERVEMLKGFVLGVFRIGDIFESALPEHKEPLANAEFTLVDESQEDARRVLHAHSPPGKARLATSYMYRKALTPVAGRSWALAATPTVDHFVANRSSQPLAIAICGFAFTALLVFYLRVISTRTMEIERLVNYRTEELSRANKELQKLSRVDRLTGVGNRRVFEEDLEKEWSTAARESRPLSLLMIDLDGFKSFNDTYGHQCGDDCLLRVAQELKRATRRPSDLVSRYGGEEFAIVLPGADGESAHVIGEKLRARIEALGIPHRDGVVTISVGVGSVIPDHRVCADALVSAADAMLYRAKKHGGNVVQSDPCWKGEARVLALG